MDQDVTEIMWLWRHRSLFYGVSVDGKPAR